MDDRSGQSLNWWRLLGWALSLVALVFVVRLLWQVDPTIWPRFRQLNIGLSLLSLVLLQGWFAVRFAMWERISRVYSVSDERPSHLRMWALSEFARYVPGNIWSFAARYRGARERGSSRAGATIALLVEAMNLVAGASVVTALFLRPGLWGLWTLGVVAYVVVMPWLVRLIATWRKWEFSGQLNWLRTMGVLSLSLLTWLLYGLAQALIIKALPGLSTPSLLILSGANVAAWLIGYLSVITPMGLGVREVALTALLASTVASGVGSVLAVLTRVWLVASELVFLGFVAVFSRKR